MEKYNPKKIEKKWQKIWEEKNYGEAQDFSKKPKHYHLVEFPYPSGEGLHVGHCMGYGASDAYCRKKRMEGFEVLFPIGWDAFGLPTENFAIKTKIKPQDATRQNVENFRRQMKSLGYSFDWSREVNTTDPDYYRWTQWIFLQFYKHGIKDGKLIKIDNNDTKTPRLAYQAEMPVNWCPSCKINLANEEVIGGHCERCDSPTEIRMQKQWMLRITKYADRLIDDLVKVDYEEKIKTQQINWIGRSTGTTIKFEIRSTPLADQSETCLAARRANSKSQIQNSKQFIEIFTTRADTLFGCTYLVLSPENISIENLKSQIKNWNEVAKYIEESKNKTNVERNNTNKTGVDLVGIKAINPISDKEIPVWVADYVVSTYGTAACMAVPAHDTRDFEFAKKYNLPIKEVIIPLAQNSNVKSQNDNLELKTAFTDYGVLINSNDFDGLNSKDAIKKITEKLEEIDAGEFSVNYKLRDWIFSRQHYWGEPIPIIHCANCGMIPLNENDLPLVLPEVEHYEPTNTGESPLAKIKSWINIKCPKCDGLAKRETDTMPNWAGSSWYYLRYCDPKNKNELSSMDKLKYWLPVDLYNGGMEHTTLHLLYSRFWHKFLFDLGAIPTIEPYQKRLTHGIILGANNQKMSKSKGNVINPDEMVKKYGADTLRAYIMFIGPYAQESAWNMTGLSGVYRFLSRLWRNCQKVSPKNDQEKLLIKLNQTIDEITKDIETFSFNTVISKLMELNNEIEKEDSISKESFRVFLQLLFPIVPHIAEDLWQKSGFDGLIEETNWPKADPKYLQSEKVVIAVQINGKTKGTIEVNHDATQKDVEEIVKTNLKFSQIVSKEKILKVIYVTGKVINFVVN